MNLAKLGLLAALLLTVPAQANETLTYDANGNVQSRSLPGGTSQYGYDDLDRLTSEAGPAKTQSLTYDANDNRLSDGTGSKTYTANTNKLATANGQTVTLDKVGNITQIRGLSLIWNQAGQLKSVSQKLTTTIYQGGQTIYLTTNQVVATYFYDYRGRRSRKVTPTETTIYIYDFADHLLGEFNASGSPLRTYIWRDDIPVAIILHGTPEKVLYLETDHLNTPIAARDENAKLVWKWESDAFGSTRPNEDPDGDGLKTTVNLRFPGQFFDKESGFHYNHHRYYDPLTGRYLSPDPIGLAGGRNSFGYVGGNPLSQVDPEGLASSGQTTQIPGGNSTTVRIDKPVSPGQQTHAHVCEKGCKEIVVNKDGTGSHGSDPSKLKNRVKNFLRSKGFKLMWCPPFVEDLVMGMAARQCAAGDLAACQIFQGMGGTIQDDSEI